MISEAIQATVVAIIANTNVNIGDEKIVTPFCVHNETELPPSLLKEGVDGYNFNVEIMIIDTLPDLVNANVVLVRAAIEALAGTTVNSTAFEQVNYEGDDPGFDTESRLYANIIRFTIEVNPASTLLPPTELTLTVISDTEIDLAWTSAYAVSIERSLNGNNFTEIFRTSAGAVTYSNTGLTEGTRYYYRIRAFSGGDYSAYTNVEYVITYAIQSPTDLTIATITGGDRLTWIDNSNNEDGFIIYVSIDGGDFVQLALTLPDVITYDDLVSTGVLEYKVVAFIGSSYSEFSDTVSTILNTYFVTTWNTENAGSATKTIEIPTNGTGYDCYVDWDDGVTDHVIGTPTGNKITHLYSTTGIKTVKISGLFPTIKFNNAGDKLKLLTIENWGYISWVSLAYSFYGCANLEGHYTDNPITDNCTSMIYAFRGCTKFNSPLICNTANVTDMQQMFNGATIFNQSVANFNLIKVTNMTMMFLNANTLSTANYDAMLIAWGAQAVKDTVTFHAGDAKYTAGGAAATARAHLVLAVVSGGHGWTITDGGAL